MPLDREYESFFALILSEELDSVDNAREILQRQEIYKSSANQQRNHVEVDFKDVLPIVIKTGEPVSKKRKKGGRSQEDYLQKGGMLAFYDLNDFRSHFGMTRSQVEDLLTDLQPHYHYERGSKLPLENVVLASLWVLASQESYRHLAQCSVAIKACCILHNMCLENTDTEPVNIEEEDLPFPPRRPCSDYQINLAGEAKRNAIAASFM
ncbi:hypothetical protein C7M84_025068 [Penaeus vannamei]|uniref:Nuclease HARBI1 n=1 Tax=Penaeus vannamei TaxID=6689 RepID=A0A3R7QXE3_PENVA|nr:hypothetical protein C7M84_025068 [Penaeus vannamei]